MQKLKDKILIFGNGQIGNFYKDHFSQLEDYSVEIDKSDITDKTAIENAIDAYKPTVVINTAAKTNLEWIKANNLEAFHINTLGASIVADVCEAKGVFYVFLSSGCIFESLNENDHKHEASKPSPQAYYSWTKVWAENLISWNRSEDFKYLILRPRQPISSSVSEKNMLIKLLTFTQYIDTPNTGTVLEDLMIWTQMLLEKRVTGVVHVANEGWSTPYNIAHLLKKHILPELEIEKISKEQLDAITPVKRVDTILDVTYLKEIVGEEHVKPYEERLEDVIIQLGENIKVESKDNLTRVLTTTWEATKQRAVPNEHFHKLYKD